MELRIEHLGTALNGFLTWVRNPRLWPWLAGAALSVAFGALLFGAYLQSHVLLSSDVGWLIRSVRLMADGERFGSDLFELNLPVAWFLCLPAAFLVSHLQLDEVTAIRCWIWMLTAVALLATWACMLATSAPRRRWQLEFVSAAIVACVLAASSFGQREHIALVLSLPYMFLAHIRLTGAQVRPAVAVAGGIISGAAFSIKPLFVLIPVVIELASLASRRREWRLFRPETIAMPAVGICCVAAILLWTPDYVSQVIPVAFATYWAYDLPFPRLLSTFPVTYLAPIAWLAALAADSRLSRDFVVWLSGFCAWTIVYVVQARGFDYHGYPAVACAIVLGIGLIASFAVRLSGLLAAAPATPLNRRNVWKLAGSLALLAWATTPLITDARYWFRSATEEGWVFSRSQAREDVIEMVRSLGIGPGNTVLAFSTHPFPAFPTVNYLGAEWVGPDMAYFSLPAWIRRHEIDDPERRMAVDEAMAVQRRHVRRALLEDKPDYLLVNMNFSRSIGSQGLAVHRLNYFEIFGSDPEVAEALAQYRKLASRWQIHVYVREGVVDRASAD